MRPSACGAADGWRLELAAAALSSLAFGGAALAVRSATRSATGEARLAERRAVLVFCASPANAFFLGAYTEAPFALCACAGSLLIIINY